MGSVFETLNVINVQDHVETKDTGKVKLSYLSWAWAWAEVKKAFPEATYTIYEAENGCFYHTDGRTCWVKTGMTIGGIEHIEYLPVMNNRNQSIALADVTSMDVNKAIQRSLTKAAARHGLGLYIYAGEDLPEAERKEEEEKKLEKIGTTKVKALEVRLDKDGIPHDLVCQLCKVSSLEEINEGQFYQINSKWEWLKGQANGTPGK